MRSPRGYLETLVRSARPSPSAAAVHAVRRPDWGPTRVLEPVDDLEVADTPVPARLTPRTRIPRPVAAPATPAFETTDAPPPRLTEPVEAGHLVPPPPVVAQVQELADAEAPVARPVVGPSPSPGPTRAPAPPPSPPTPPAARLREEARLREVAPLAPPRLPVGTEAAFERLEHLARRFSAALPVDVDRPAPTPAPAERDETPVDRPAFAVPAPSLALAPMSAAPPRELEPARVEIGSIEVFVTQPPAPAAVAASVPARVAVATPAPPERLSRPLHPYGFGQG